MEELAAEGSMGENIKGKRYTTAKDYLMSVQDQSQVEDVMGVVQLTETTKNKAATPSVFYEVLALFKMNVTYNQPSPILLKLSLNLLCPKCFHPHHLYTVGGG